MKYTLLTLLSLVTFSLFGQHEILLSYHKNVHLIFSYDIIKDDCSSQDILISHDKNILKLGVAQPFESEKSITVLTEQNMLFTFVVRYDESLKTLAHIIPDSIGIKIPYNRSVPKESIKSDVSGEEFNISHLNELCTKVYSESNIFNEIGSTYKKITIELAGIWVNEDVLFFKLLMGNDSNIPYDISSANLYIKEKGTVKKSSSVPIEKTPFYVFNELKQIPPKSLNNVYIMVFDSFTISHNKKLVLEVVEKDGGRRVEFDILQDLIISAPLIN